MPSLAYLRPRHVAWAALLRRTFPIDVLACPPCGGRPRLIASLAAPALIATILSHLGRPVVPPEPEPARRPDWLAGLGADGDEAAYDDGAGLAAD